MPTSKKIKVTKNGPYQVIGSVPVNELRFVPNAKGASVDYEEVKKYPVKESYYLCRCGMSKNKPFCDNTHISIGFNGTETAKHSTYENEADFIEGILMDLKDDRVFCAGARFCDTKSGIWNLVTTAGNEDAKDIIKHQATHCPSGRLTAVTKEGEDIEPELPQEISALYDTAAGTIAPLWVKGGIVVEDSQGKTYEVRNRVTLCRCGKSENKPFCNGSHLRTTEEL